jgi:electron transport complex protein RnfG
VKGSDPGGYGGDVVLMVGFMSDKTTVVCYKTLAAAETPGLGMKLNTPEFAGQFAGKDGSSLSVKKDGGEIDAITSATITSRAVCGAIAAAAQKLR